jgi:phage-related minor tail protein
LFLASGGPVSPGGAYVVGEQGPELFKPSSAGTIIPNSALGGASGGGGDTYTYNIDARGAQQGFVPQIMATIQASEDRAVARSVKAVKDLSLRTA